MKLISLYIFQGMQYSRKLVLWAGHWCRRLEFRIKNECRWLIAKHNLDLILWKEGFKRLKEKAMWNGQFSKCLWNGSQKGAAVMSSSILFCIWYKFTEEKYRINANEHMLRRPV